MPTKLTILKRLLFLLAVMSFLPACYAETGYSSGYYYRRPYYREGYYYRAPPPRRTVVVVPRGHERWEHREYYRAPASHRDYRYRHHEEHHHHHRD